MLSFTHSLFLTILLVFSCFLTPSFSHGIIDLSGCNRNFSCGHISNVSYPFSGGDRPGHCGLPEFNFICQPNNVTEFTHNSVTYRVLGLNQTTKSLTISRVDLYDNICPSRFSNSTLNSSLFSSGDLDSDLHLFYGCNTTTAMIRRPLNLFNCTIPNINFTDAYYIVGPVPSDPVLGFIYCSLSVTVPILRSVGMRLTENRTSLVRALMDGFTVNYTDPYGKMCSECNGLGGQCGFDTSLGEPICICGNGPCQKLFAPPPDDSVNASALPKGSSGGVNTPMSIGLAIAGAVIAGVGLGWLIFFCKQRRKRHAAESSQVVQTVNKELPTTPLANKAHYTPPDIFTRSIPSYPSSKSEFGRSSSYFGVQVFSYQELEEATDNFSGSRELGDGGFGTVYYGILSDGRIVAVKRLYENNFKRVEQFMNEVEILTRLRHTNLVTLYGCTSKRSRELLLVYEYIPNGTVADHLNGNRSKSGLLSWPVRLNIAIETADALSYLHASDIIHRDVKTNNILLDNDFHVKVADFGLSRLFPNDVTHVSTAPQGTPGYVDPEYYQCYQLTEKSDVYSFGVVLIELLSSLQAVDTNRDRHDVNLANMAVNKIQNQTLDELIDPSLDFGTNSSVRRMITQVCGLAFRCLQQERDMRPSMQEVADTLRKIQNESLNAQKVEVVDILIDDGGIVKDNVSPPSPDSVTDKMG